MSLCTLHPSLSMLASNLELSEQLKLAIFESVSELEHCKELSSSETGSPNCLTLALDSLLGRRTELEIAAQLKNAKDLLASLLKVIVFSLRAVSNSKI